MARNDDFDYYIPADWYGPEASLYDDLVNGDPVIAADPGLQLLFDVALFDQDIRPDEREAARDVLANYLWSEYGIDFDDVFDWEGYREWYENA